MPDFGEVLSTVTTESSESSDGGITNVNADCPADQYVTGGGCVLLTTSSPGEATIKANIPSTGSDPRTGWYCSCAAGSGNTCQVEAQAVCVDNSGASSFN